MVRCFLIIEKFFEVFFLYGISELSFYLQKGLTNVKVSVRLFLEQNPSSNQGSRIL